MLNGDTSTSVKVNSSWSSKTPNLYGFVIWFMWEFMCFSCLFHVLKCTKRPDGAILFPHQSGQSTGFPPPPCWLTPNIVAGGRGHERRKSVHPRQQPQHLFTRMDSQEVGDLLEECLRAVAAAPRSTQPAEAEKLSCLSCRGQTRDGAVCSLFIQGPGGRQIWIFFLRDLVVEFHSHEIGAYGLCWEQGTKAFFFSINTKWRWFFFSLTQSMCLPSAHMQNASSKWRKGRKNWAPKRKKSAHFLFWFWHELCPAIRNSKKYATPKTVQN